MVFKFMPAKNWGNLAGLGGTLFGKAGKAWI